MAALRWRVSDPSDPRLDAIVETLTAFARHDFSPRAPVTGTDTIDAIATGLNMLAEELHATVASRAELEEANARLVAAGRMAAVGMLAAGVAHEINNPLAGVMACVKALRDQAMVEPRRTEYFATVLDGLERIQSTVSGLLDYARQRSPSPSPVDVGEVLGAAVLLVAPALRKKDVQVVVRDPGAARVVADRAQLMQGLVNVLLNAIFASPAHGEITVEVAGSWIVVVDQGPGFAPETLLRACDPFFTTKPEGEGTGLGLAVTASIVKANGGRLELGNGPRGGARVAIWLPGVAG